MCGICGKVHFDAKKPVTESMIRVMNQALKHRGPDDEGVYVKENVGLGHRRLSIIDLSSAGHQPMCNEDGTVWITFNGEIYNFQSLKPDLEKRGHVFRSHTDTEVIIHLYEEYGENCLRFLRGMFAFALWDHTKKKLLLARDRLGKKPLKYFIGKDYIVFASELKAFLKSPDVPCEIDLEAVHHFLTFQYVPAPQTGFKGIEKLPPAHYLIVDLSGKTPKIYRRSYWDLDFSQKMIFSEQDWGKMILEKLEESVRLRLISDVPLGAFLSGGIDSSAVVALMARNMTQPVKTFSIGFEEQKYNELPFAELIAKKFGTHHTSFIVKPKEFLSSINDLVYHYEEPFADSSALPTYFVSKLTRQFVTVALNGDGGDENFAGYPWYRIHAFTALYYAVPECIRKYMKAFFYRPFSSIPSLFFQRAAAFLESTTLPPELQYHYYCSYFYPEEKLSLYNPVTLQHLKDLFSGNILSQWYLSSGSENFLDRALYTDIKSYLPGALLPKVDIASMAVSLETRSPFLDHEFMELCAKLPARFKQNIAGQKYILKKLLKDILPNEILNKPKWGFQIPLGEWFKNDLREYAYDTILSSEFVNMYLKKESIRSLLDSHVRTSVGDGRKIWALLSLVLWYKRFFTHHG